MTHSVLIDLAVLAAFGALLFIPVLIEMRKRKNAPKPTGATKI